MASKRDIEYWLLEYACQHNHLSVIQEILTSKSASSFGIPSVRLALSGIVKIITSDTVAEFETCVETLEHIHATCPNVIPFRLFAQLTSALKIKVLFHKLFSNETSILETVNQYFPRKGLTYETENHRTLKKLNESSLEFRKFFLAILANEKLRTHYMQTDYENEFGSGFNTRIKKLLEKLVVSVNSHLPPSTIDKLLSASSSGTDIGEKLKDLEIQSPWMELLLDSVANKSILSTADLYGILRTTVSPVLVQDGAVPSHTLSILTVNQDSGDSETETNPPLLTKAVPKMCQLAKPLPLMPEDVHRQEKTTPASNRRRKYSTVNQVDFDTVTCDYILSPTRNVDDKNTVLAPSTEYQSDNRRLIKAPAQLVNQKRSKSIFPISPIKGDNPRSTWKDKCRVTSPAKATPQIESQPVFRSVKLKRLSPGESTSLCVEEAGSRKKSERKSFQASGVDDDKDLLVSTENKVNLNVMGSHDSLDESDELTFHSPSGRSVSDIDRSVEEEESGNDSEMESDAVPESDTTIQSSIPSSRENIETKLDERVLHSHLISPYRKQPNLKLCVVKLFQKEIVTDSGIHCLYS